MPNARRRRRLAAALALAVVLSTLSAFTFGSPAWADITIEASTPVPLGPPAGGHVPIQVTVKADRLIQGTLEVQSMDRFGPQGTSLSLVAQPIEVPGGSEKQVVIVVPGSIVNGGMEGRSLQFRVVLKAGDTEVAQRAVNVPVEVWTETVGVLPKLAARTKVPDTSALRFEAGKARIGTVPSAILAAGSAALEPYGTIVGGTDDLEALAPDERRAILQWLAHGGHLVVDTDSLPLPGIPEAWQPGPGGWSFAGGGEIRLSSGDAENGRWSDVLEPTAAESSIASRRANQNVASVNGRLMGQVSLPIALADAAGFRMPDFTVLLVALAAYVLFVGPVLFITLAKAKRRMAFWVAVPLTASLASVGFVIAGGALRSGSDAAQATVIETGPMGNRADAVALVGSTSGGTLDVSYPSGWVARDPADLASSDGCGGCTGGFGNFGGFGGFGNAGGFGGMQGETVPVMPFGSASRAHLELDPGEYRIAAAQGPLEGAPALEVTATVESGIVKGTVRNVSSGPMHAVLVLVGASALKVGDIAAGASATFEADAAKLVPAYVPEAEFWDLTTAQLDRGQGWFMGGPGMVQSTVMCAGPGCAAPLNQKLAPVGPSGQANPVNGPAWLAYLSSSGAALRSGDQLTVVGWAGGELSPVQIDGRGPITRGHVAVVARTNLSVTGRLKSLGSRIERVRDTDIRADNQREGPADLRVNGPITRIVLPPTVDGKAIRPQDVVVRLPSGVTEALVWVGNGFRLLKRPAGESRLEVRLGDDSVERGVVFIRTGFTEEFSAPDDPLFGFSAFDVITGDDSDEALDAAALTEEELAGFEAEDEARRQFFAAQEDARRRFFGGTGTNTSPTSTQPPSTLPAPADVTIPPGKVEG